MLTIVSKIRQPFAFALVVLLCLAANVGLASAHGAKGYAEHPSQDFIIKPDTTKSSLVSFNPSLDCTASMRGSAENTVPIQDRDDTGCQNVCPATSCMTGLTVYMASLAAKLNYTLMRPVTSLRTSYSSLSDGLYHPPRA